MKCGKDIHMKKYKEDLAKRQIEIALDFAKQAFEDEEYSASAKTYLQIAQFIHNWKKCVIVDESPEAKRKKELEKKKKELEEKKKEQEKLNKERNPNE